MKWSVRLYGDSKLLKELEHCLKSDEVMVKYKEKNFYLYSKYFKDLKDDREVFKVASKLVILINGAIKFFLNSDEMINFNAINSVDENNISKSIVFIRGSAHIKTSTKGTLQGGKIKGINKITRWIPFITNLTGMLLYVLTSDIKIIWSSLFLLKGFI
ncbi:unnamed protein product [marine sediment metagenome]|uniref:Uncharacterized protein n=1 Tax=marine sediment metagenome TaxID=412755 RepID=X1GSG5_9ZZZZ